MDSKPVIVGVDGSPDSLRALRWAAEYARDHGAPLQAVSVYEMPVVWGGAYAIAALPDSKELAAKAREVLTDSVREALGEGAEVSERVEEGHPARVLVNASRAAQLVVVGSRGHGGFAGLLLGSVSQYCVTHARCPVLVLPHEETAK